MIVTDSTEPYDIAFWIIAEPTTMEKLQLRTPEYFHFGYFQIRKSIPESVCLELNDDEVNEIFLKPAMLNNPILHSAKFWQITSPVGEYYRETDVYLGFTDPEHAALFRLLL